MRTHSWPGAPWCLRGLAPRQCARGQTGLAGGPAVAAAAAAKPGMRAEEGAVAQFCVLSRRGCRPAAGLCTCLLRGPLSLPPSSHQQVYANAVAVVLKQLQAQCKAGRWAVNELEQLPQCAMAEQHHPKVLVAPAEHGMAHAPCLHSKSLLGRCRRCTRSIASALRQRML